MVDYDSVKIRY